MKQSNPKIFVLAPNAEFSDELKGRLHQKGFSAHTQYDLPQTGHLQKNSFDLVISFFKNPECNSDNCTTYRALYLSRQGDLTDQICLQKDGYYEFKEKQSLETNVARIISHISQIHNNHLPEIKTSNKIIDEGEAALAKIIGNSPQIRKVKTMIQRISRFPDGPVLITGETGTGKELVADALHACSPRANKPMIKINCSAIPENLLESQLFGHRKGAFSGATQSQKGLVEEVADGTLFLDEISSLKLELQPKLLRFLEDGSYLPVGDVREQVSNACIIAATNVNLEDMINRGQFRTDLYYRLRRKEITMPPLRERQEDIFKLTQHFMKECSTKFELKTKKLSDKVQEIFMIYDWPGNVRELRNLVQEIITATEHCQIRVQDLPRTMKRIKTSQNIDDNLTIKEMEKKHILKILEQNDWKIRMTARDLGITRPTLRTKLKSYGLLQQELMNEVG